MVICGRRSAAGANAMAMRWSWYVWMTGFVCGLQCVPSHVSCELSVCVTLYPSFFSSLTSAVRRSVSFIFRLWSPVRWNGRWLSAQVTANVWARSGCSTKSAFMGWAVVGCLVSFMVGSPFCLSVWYVVLTPSGANFCATVESPCMLSGVNPVSVICVSGSVESATIWYQYDAALQSFSM